MSKGRVCCGRVEDGVVWVEVWCDVGGVVCPHLVVVEHAVCDGVPPDDSGRPQLLHEEHLVCEVVGGGVLGWTGTLEPFCQVAHKVKEEVTLRHTDHWRGRRSGWVRLVLDFSPI